MAFVTYEIEKPGGGWVNVEIDDALPEEEKQRQIGEIQADLYYRFSNPVPSPPGQEGLPDIRDRIAREKRRQDRSLWETVTSPEFMEDVIEPWKEEPTRRMAGALGGMAAGMKGMTKFQHPLAVTLPWLGATGGEVAAEYLGDIAEGKSMKEALTDAEEVAKWSAGVNFGLPVASVGWQMTRRMMAARALGIPLNEVEDWLIRFGEYNIPVGIVDITKVSAIKAMESVLGRVPILSGPYRKHQARQREALLKKVPILKELNELVPTADAQILGINFKDAGINNSREMLIEYTRAYKAADRAARVLGNDAVPTDAMKAVAERLAKEGNLPYLINKTKVTLPADKLHHARVTDRYKVTPMKGAKPDEVQKFVAQWAKLPDRISIRHWRNIKQELTALHDQAAVKGYREKTLGQAWHGHQNAQNQLLAQLQDGVAVGKLAGMDANTARVLGKSIASRYAYANNLFGTAQNLWKTRGARPFKQVDKNFFKREFLLGGWKEPGAANADQLFKTAYKTDSAETLQQLRSIVGDENMVRGWQHYWDEALISARTPTKGGMLPEEGIIIDTDKLLKSIGFLPGGKVASPTVLKEMLKGTGTTPESLGRFVSVLSKFDQITSPAQMLSRSVALKGMPGITRALGVGAMAAGVGIGIFKAIAMAALLRGGGVAVTSPELLKNLTKLGEMALRSKGSFYGTFSAGDIPVRLAKEGIPAGAYMKLVEEISEQVIEVELRRMQERYNAMWESAEVPRLPEALLDRMGGIYLE